MRKRDRRLVTTGGASANNRAWELAECEPKASLRSDGLEVPAGQTVHVTIDAEAGNAPAQLWLDIVQKIRRDKEPKPLRQREIITLKAKERRTFRYDVDLPQGSRGVEARLGLATQKDRATLHDLKVYQGDPPAEPAPEARASEGDGGISD